MEYLVQKYPEGNEDVERKLNILKRKLDIATETIDISKRVRCNESFQHNRNLKRHEEMHIGRKNKSTDCSKNYKRSDKLKHYRVKHSGGDDTKSRGKTFTKSTITQEQEKVFIPTTNTFNDSPVLKQPGVAIRFGNRMFSKSILRKQSEESKQNRNDMHPYICVLCKTSYKRDLGAKLTYNNFLKRVKYS